MIRTRRLLVVGLCLTQWTACGPADESSRSSECEDRDRDGFGIGTGCLGADCNDNDTSVFPGAPELCDGLDNNCDGIVDNGCKQCTPGALQPCYSGPVGTEGVGSCRAGARQCDPPGLWSATCVGEVPPRAELCGNGLDDDCNGSVDETCASGGSGSGGGGGGSGGFSGSAGSGGSPQGGSGGGGGSTPCGHTVDLYAPCLDHLRTDLPNGTGWNAVYPSGGWYSWTCVSDDALLRYQIFNAAENAWGCNNSYDSAPGEPTMAPACAGLVQLAVDGMSVPPMIFIDWQSPGACNFAVCTKALGCEYCCNGKDDDYDGLVDGSDPDCPATPSCWW